MFHGSQGVEARQAEYETAGGGGSVSHIGRRSDMHVVDMDGRVVYVRSISKYR